MAGTVVGAGLDRSRSSARILAASGSPRTRVWVTQSNTGRSADQIPSNVFKVVASDLPTPCNQVSAWPRASSGLGARRLPKEAVIASTIAVIVVCFPFLGRGALGGSGFLGFLGFGALFFRKESGKVPMG